MKSYIYIYIIYNIYKIRCILTEKYENNLLDFVFKEQLHVFICIYFYFFYLTLYLPIHLFFLDALFSVCPYLLFTYFPFMYLYANFHIYLVFLSQIYPFFMVLL